MSDLRKLVRFLALAVGIYIRGQITAPPERLPVAA